MVSPVKVWRNQKATQSVIGKTGRIITWTMVRVPLSGYGREAPYPVAVVELTGGRRLTVQVVDYRQGDLQSGMRVRTVLRRIAEPDADGVIMYGIKVTPERSVPPGPANA